MIADFESEGYGGKFYPCFYDLISKKHDEIFPPLSRDSAMAICLDLADQILAYLTAGFSLEITDIQFQLTRGLVVVTFILQVIIGYIELS